MTRSSDLIPAKLNRPPLRPEFVARPGLIERLDRGLGGRVTLVSAAAGYGKSTLVAQWLASASAPPSAWFALDPLDSDLERFSRYLIAALRTIDPGCLDRTESLVSAQTLPPPERLAETLAIELGAVGRAVLVLDDYAVVHGEAVHRLMQILVPQLPDSIHLVLVSRVDPPLPLGRWRTRSWLHELRSGDLRFSRVEVSALFQAPGVPTLNDDAIALLHDKTEGWIAGLRLAMMSLSEAADPEARVHAFSASNRLIMDYFMEEALAAQPPEIREFMALTAPLERFCARLCDDLLAGRRDPVDSRQVLDRLYRQNVFLFPLGAQDGWYRYHHLFRQLLMDRLPELLPGVRGEDISLRAGAWFAREGWIEEGLQYLVAAGDLDGAADLVAEHLTEVINRDLSRRTLARWLAMFPPDAERGRLPLIVATLYMMILRWDFDGMLRLLHEADNTCRDLEGKRYRRWWRELEPDLETLQGYARYWAGDITGAQEHLMRALASSPDPSSYQQSLALVYHGGTLALTGRRSEYVSFLEEGQIREEVAGGPQFGPYLVVRACVHFYRAELDECRGAAQRMTQASTEAVVPKYWLGIGYYLLGVVAYERDLLDEAEAHFRKVESLRFDSAPMFCHHALVGLVWVSLARGEHEFAEQRAAAARRYAHEIESPTALQDMEWLDRRLAVAAGRIQMSRFPRPRSPDFMRVAIGTPSQTWAWLQLTDPAQGAVPALAFIDGARRQAETHGVTRYVIQASILRAIALDRLGRREDAVAELASAVRRAEPQGLVRSFVDPGTAARELLLQVARRESDSAYVERLIAASRTAEGGAARSPVHHQVAGVQPTAGVDARTWPASGELLTNRELDVLELLQERLTNKEIAARLSITAETVRKHTLSIYSKLEVHGRRQAVAEGLARGILTPP